MAYVDLIANEKQQLQDFINRRLGVKADVTAIKTIVQLQEQRIKKTAAVWQ
jgi:hypothetical protein